MAKLKSKNRKNKEIKVWKDRSRTGLVVLKSGVAINAFIHNGRLEMQNKIARVTPKKSRLPLLLLL
jgi:hypothetical protein